MVKQSLTIDRFSETKSRVSSKTVAKDSPNNRTFVVWLRAEAWHDAATYTSLSSASDAPEQKRRAERACLEFKSAARRDELISSWLHLTAS